MADSIPGEAGLCSAVLADTSRDDMECLPAWVRRRYPRTLLGSMQVFVDLHPWAFRREEERSGGATEDCNTKIKDMLRMHLRRHYRFQQRMATLREFVFHPWRGCWIDDARDQPAVCKPRRVNVKAL